MKAIHAISRGEARQSLRIADIEPPPPPGARSVLVNVEYAPLNKHDLLSIAGVLPALPPPWVPGNEGTGIVSAVGSEVTEVKVGDRVVLPPLSGSWREQLVVPADGLFPLPDADPLQLAMIGINPPTAILMLDEFTDVLEGSYVVQDAANSGVGRSLIAVAHARGLKTINLARNQATFDELRAAGADIVLPDSPESVGTVRSQIGDATVALAVDGLGGPSTETLATLLSPGGVLVAYAAESGAPLSVPLPPLTGYGVTVRGIFLGAWDFPTKIAPAVREAAALVASGALVVPVAGTFSLDRIPEALDQLERGGKVLLDVGAAAAAR
jgi:NADPH:quinone reductase-like Zn-dependent oxidoreductase